MRDDHRGRDGEAVAVLVVGFCDDAVIEGDRYVPFDVMSVPVKSSYPEFEMQKLPLLLSPLRKVLCLTTSTYELLAVFRASRGNDVLSLSTPTASLKPFEVGSATASTPKKLRFRDET
jgi:hypothetical protein